MYLDSCLGNLHLESCNPVFHGYFGYRPCRSEANGVPFLVPVKDFSPLVKESLKRISDLTIREKVCLYPFVILIIVLGFYPNVVLNIFSPSLKIIIEGIE